MHTEKCMRTSQSPWALVFPSLPQHTHTHTHTRLGKYTDTPAITGTHTNTPIHTHAQTQTDTDTDRLIYTRTGIGGVHAAAGARAWARVGDDFPSLFIGHAPRCIGTVCLKRRHNSQGLPTARAARTDCAAIHHQARPVQRYVYVYVYVCKRGKGSHMSMLGVRGHTYAGR
jgi:hypothetical protein